MKKIIGILGVVVIAVTLFFSTNTISENNMDLESLVAVNIASAEMDPDGDHCSSEDNSICYVGTGLSFTNCDEDEWWTLSDCF